MGLSDKLGLLLGACAAAVALIALGFSAYTYHLTTSGSGTISTGAIRTTSLTMGGETATTVSGTATSAVVQTGTFNVRVTYFDPAQPGIQQSHTAAGGTYTYNAVTVSGAIQHVYLELSTFSYTFNQIATATSAQFSITGLTPTFVATGVQSFYICTPYIVTLSTTGTTAPYNVLSMTSTPEFTVFFYNTVTPTINSGFTISTTSPIRTVIGTIAL